MEYRIDRDALAEFISRQVAQIEAASIPKLLADVVELRLRHEAVSAVDPRATRSAEAMIAAAGLGWRVEQHPLEAVLDGGAGTRRVPVPKHVANVRSDTGAVVGVVGEGYEPLQNRAAFAFCDAITDSGRAHWIGAGEARGGARVHALMRLDREIRIGGAEGEEVLPLLCFRN